MTLNTVYEAGKLLPVLWDLDLGRWCKRPRSEMKWQHTESSCLGNPLITVPRIEINDNALKVQLSGCRNMLYVIGSV